MKPSETSHPARILVIGVGNDLRGDDGAGLLAARKVKARRVPGVRVIESAGDGAALMETWADESLVFVIDATAAAEVAGAVRRFEAHCQPLPAPLFNLSTHSFGLAEAIELSRTLGRLPRELIVYGIEGEVFETSRPSSPAVEASIDAVSETVLSEIRKRLSAAV